VITSQILLKLFMKFEVRSQELYFYFVFTIAAFLVSVLNLNDSSIKINSKSLSGRFSAWWISGGTPALKDL
jgi:hypothetical protein